MNNTQNAYGANGSEADNTEDVLKKFSNADDFINQANEKEFVQLAVAHAKIGFKYLQEQRQFSYLPLLERITRRLNEFKQKLIDSSAALAGFNIAFGSGGRSKFRDAVNAYFGFITINFKIMKDLIVKMITDIIRGKRFTEVLVDLNTLTYDIVKEIKKDPENVKIIKAAVKDLKNTAECILKNGGLGVLEFPGTVSLYDNEGKLRSSEDIYTEFVTNRCNHVRGMIRKLLAANRQEYDEAATELLRTGIPMASVLVELEKKFQRALPVSIPTEGSIKDQLNKDDYPALCKLYNSLKLDSKMSITYDAEIV
ncbi:MAG: hypothetical protein FWF55_08910 [Treponema sp.]|nr:hypothetical protein [Treponema sp.]